MQKHQQHITKYVIANNNKMESETADLALVPPPGDRDQTTLSHIWLVPPMAN